MGFEKQIVEIDGISYPYLNKGHQNETIVLVHGYAADKESWLGYARLLASKRRVVMLDLPGFGDAARSMDLDYSPRVQADRLAAFIRQVSDEPVHVIGSSMGGYISAWLAILHPQRVATLTLMNAAGVFGANASKVQDAAESGENALMVRNTADLNRLFALLAYRKMRLPWFVKRHLLRQYEHRAEHLERVFWQLVDAQESDAMQSRLPEISAPTLVLWGDSDDIIDVSCADVYAAEIPNATRLVLPNVGHIPMFEAPRKSAAAHETMMQKHAGR
ncbi:MAG: alpha/beta hydrolase [Pseudomonadota bacterium]